MTLSKAKRDLQRLGIKFGHGLNQLVPSHVVVGFGETE